MKNNYDNHKMKNSNGEPIGEEDKKQKTGGNSGLKQTLFLKHITRKM